MYKKILITLLLAALLGSVFAGCATQETTVSPTAATTTAAEDITESTTAAVTKVQVGFSVADSDDAWLSSLTKAARVKAKEMNDVAEFTFVDAKNDPELQLVELEVLIKRGCKAIVINPVDLENTSALTNMAKDAGVTLIIVNRPIRTEANAYIGPDLALTGSMQLDQIATKLGGKGNVAIMAGDLNSSGNSTYVNSIKKAQAERYPKMKITVIEDTKWDRAKAQAQMEEWIKSDSTQKDAAKLDAVIAQNDEMAIGAAKAIQTAGLAGKILVSGLNGSVDALNQMADGSMSFTVFQDPTVEGYAAIVAAVKAASGETYEANTQTNLEAVSPDAVSAYLEKWKQIKSTEPEDPVYPTETTGSSTETTGSAGTSETTAAGGDTTTTSAEITTAATSGA